VLSPWDVGASAASGDRSKKSKQGMVVPAGGEDTLGSDQDAFIGRFEINSERLKPTPLFHTDHTSEKGFTTTGVIEYVDGRTRQSISVVALEDGETSLVIDWTVADVELSLNEGFGVYIMNDFVNGNRVQISFEGGRRTVRGVGGRARGIETGPTWIKIAGCLGIETDGEPLFYEDASERNPASQGATGGKNILGRDQLAQVFTVTLTNRLKNSGCITPLPMQSWLTRSFVPCLR
jgi:hypothetical protein